MSSFLLRPTLAVTGTLLWVSAARAQTYVPPLVQPFGQTVTPTTPTPVTQRQFADAASSQINFLGAIRDWRDTMRGSGKTPRRNFAPAPLGKKFALSLGSVAPPIMGAGAGLTANFKGIEIGSTAQPAALNDVLARFDSVMTGDKVVAPDQTQMTWLRARPVQTKNSELELSMSRGRRDMLAGEGEKWVAGNFQNARARINLPAQWALRSNFTRSEMETQSKSTDAWDIDASGPIVHPFGVAKARFTWSDVDAGYATLAAPDPVVGQKNGALEVAQDVAIGPVSGNLKVAATKRERAEDNAKVGEEIGADGATSQAQMRLAITPNLSLTSTGSVQIAAVTRALQDQNAVSVSAAPAASESTPDTASDSPLPSDALLSPSQARELSQQMAGDFGVEWKFSRALSVSVSTGASRARAQREAGDLWSDGDGSDENRRAVEVRHKTSAADLRVRLAQRERRSISASASGTAAEISQWRVEAARRLLGGMSLKTIVDIAHDDGSDLSAHRYEAQLQLNRAARLDARYREGNVAPGLLSDEWVSTFAAPDASARQWSARFNAGSAAAGAGLGLALEYARSAGSAPDMWRIGLQFK